LRDVRNYLQVFTDVWQLMYTQLRLQTAGDYSELRGWIEGVEYMQYTLPLLAPREFFFTGLGNPLRRPLLVRVRDVV
jgi:hypothetical protein